MIELGSDKADLELRPVLKGQKATFEVEGGFARKPAPCDGLLIETRTSTFLVPVAELERALAQLRRCLGRSAEKDSP